ncbi:MAG: MBL fold metallo-hydrolase [Thermodesulfobacteriota bacterium]
METERTRVLIDAGLSCREILRRLNDLHVDAMEIDALIITHEHTDHIRGAGPLARRLGIPVYINGSTYRQGLKALGHIHTPVVIQTGQTLTIGDLNVETFTKCHDAADPIGLVVSCNGCRLGLITDLGRSTRVVEDRLRGCRALIVEFNHDVKKLDAGPYPLFLKRRIVGPDGHLSNDQAADLVRALAHEDLAVLVPAHLSLENNLPETARREAARALDDCGLVRSRVEMSSQNESTPLLDLLRP